MVQVCILLDNFQKMLFCTDLSSSTTCTLLCLCMFPVCSFLHSSVGELQIHHLRKSVQNLQKAKHLWVQMVMFCLRMFAENQLGKNWPLLLVTVAVISFYWIAERWDYFPVTKSRSSNHIASSCCRDSHHHYGVESSSQNEHPIAKACKQKNLIPFLQSTYNIK